MLAAAGSPSVHPHASDDDTIQARWDRDVSHAPTDVDELSRFFVSVVNGRVPSADSVRRQAFTYFGVQGPWYTVGWVMASTIERELGRDALVHSLCEPTRFIALYNDAAHRANSRCRHRLVRYRGELRSDPSRKQQLPGPLNRGEHRTSTRSIRVCTDSPALHCERGSNSRGTALVRR
jgi:hypothetical protein